jgi:pimeloyl-ACP methyl ester carboxylesterase
MVADVFTVLDAYGVERCVLAAESMGALSVLGAALKQPERITGLVIVDGMYYRKPNPEPDLFLMGLKMDYPQTIQRFVQMCAPEPTDEPIRYWGRQIVDRATQASALALYHLAGAVDLRNALPRINQPTLIIHCDGDALVPLDAARALAKTLPHARLNIIRGASHVPTLTHPHAVAHAIVEFFKQA